MMKRTDVVTVFLIHSGKILIVRRSQNVRTYRGRWSAISGYLEREPLAQAYTEVAEETGLSKANLNLITQGEPVDVHDVEHQRHWRVHPFVFEISGPEKICLDWENVEYRWVSPETIQDLNTVPDLANVLSTVWP